MKYLGVLLLACLGVVFSGCGGGSGSSNTVTGNWAATLSNPGGSAALAFTTSLSQNSGSTTVNVTNLSFNTSTSCFSSGTTETGSFVLSGNFNGQVSGAYQMTIQSGTPSGNLLTLQGSVNNNVISGTWTLTGTTAGCTGSGNFLMNKM